MKDEIQIHVVEYVAVSAGTTEDGPAVIATIRPDIGSFRPHNLGFNAEEADRLRRDLNRLFKRSRTLQAWRQSPEAQSE